MAAQAGVDGNTLYIGDNLDILRGLNSESVDLIYLNPPRNSGRSYRASATSRAGGVEYDDTWTADHMRRDWLKEIELRQPDAVSVINMARIIHDAGMAAYLTFMAVRLIELRRALKLSGSIYMHCSPHASYYLKALMDGIFGHEQFKSDISWRRRPEPSGSRRWRSVHDALLFYAGPRKNRWRQVRQAHPPEHRDRYYTSEDERGRYQHAPLTGAGLMRGERGEVWRGIDPGKTGRHWNVPVSVLKRALPRDESYIDSLGPIQRLDLLEQLGLVHWPMHQGMPRYKIYEDLAEGAILSDLITTIQPIESRATEETGWPGQVPIELLELIITASSDPGDLVLDPFCGSGTACVAAQKLGRSWVGIERLEHAAGVMSGRLRRETDSPEYTITPDPPRRTDGESEYPTDSEEIRRALYAEQDGRCKGCEEKLPAHLLTLDRVEPPTGRRGRSSLQLLCLYCKSVRGDRGMDYLTAQLFRQGILRAT